MKLLLLDIDCPTFVCLDVFFTFFPHLVTSLGSGVNSIIPGV